MSWCPTQFSGQRGFLNGFVLDAVRSEDTETLPHFQATAPWASCPYMLVDIFLQAVE